MASFFDYDNDGDLDMYLTVNEAQSTDNTSSFRPIIKMVPAVIQAGYTATIITRL
jgi:hypothetical protein